MTNSADIPNAKNRYSFYSENATARNEAGKATHEFAQTEILGKASELLEKTSKAASFTALNEGNKQGVEKLQSCVTRLKAVLKGPVLDEINADQNEEGNSFQP